MDATLALVVLGGGALIVWALTQGASTGQFANMLGQAGQTMGGVPTNSSGRPFLTDAQVEYYTSGFATHLTNAQAAATGASAGSTVAGLTFGISIGVGALAGYLSVRNSNDTKEDRSVFALRLGFTGANNDGLGIHTQMPTDINDKSKGIYSYLTFIGRDDLRDTAMRVIGRKDFAGNVQWMADTLVALWQANFNFPR
jgi:hypothetical protein